MAAINDAKLALLRARLVEAGLDALVVGSGDAHSSEYVAEWDHVLDFTCCCCCCRCCYY